MDRYINSMDYADVLRSATAKIDYENAQTEEFFKYVQSQLLDMLAQVQNQYASRTKFVDETGMYEYKNPDDLPDFESTTVEVANRNYEAWETFVDCSGIYDADTEALIDIIRSLNRAIDAIGVI
jgi:hypothetical protein